MTKKTLGEMISDTIGMAPLHLTGITAIAKGIEVVGDLAAGKTPKPTDVIGAAGLLDADGIDDAVAGDADLTGDDPR